MRAMMILAALCVMSMAADAPATKPVKPPTYAELKAENERLWIEIASLRATIKRLEAAATPQAAIGGTIKKGLTLAEAQAIAGYPPTLVSEDSDGSSVYTLNVWPDPKTQKKYTLTVRGGKIAEFTVAVKQHDGKDAGSPAVERRFPDR